MPDQMQGTPSHWNTYVTVDDLSPLPEKVTAAGGTVIAPPFDVLGSGDMMTVQDPTGAFINFWQPKTHIGAGIVNTHGAMVWNELATRDASAAKAFFGDVLGWTFEPGEDTFYTYIHNRGRLNGGIIEMNEMWGDMPPHWQVYFSVADIDDIAKRTTELGGRILSGVDSTSVGRFAVIADPSGAMFAAIQLNQIAPWQE
jgi:hypothetical protein